MPRGFFPDSAVATGHRDLRAPRCGECGLYKTCRSPKMPVYGRGGRKVLIVGEAPGREEDVLNKPFQGKAGRFLQEVLSENDFDMERDCWVTNSLVCRPPRNQIANDRMIDWCRPNVVKAVRDLNPEVVLLLGKRPMESLIKWLWKDTVITVGTWVGWRIPAQKVNAWVCPTWHPSYLLRLREDDTKRNYGVEEKLFRQHVKAALQLQGRPWKKVPDYKKQVRVFLDPDDAVECVREYEESPGPVAFDFETDRLKPDPEDSEIVCCSLSDGKTSVAFPWHGKVVDAAKKLLTSRVPKIGANAKFEERWCLRHLGVGVKNWAWDTVLAAHCLDNRPGVTSVKFQAFALLGVEDYDSRVKPYLEAPGGNARNRIRELELDKVLTYCALDSLLEHKVAKAQAREMGVKL